MGVELSIAICTYNRSNWLRICLESLVKQCGDDARVEVLIIDNNSSDDTSNVAKEYTDKLTNFRYLLEKTQGLSNARNRGYSEASGKYVAYIDDDARAHPDWVDSILEFFELHANAAGVGGPYNGFSTVPIPDWFPKEYGSRSLGDETRIIKDDEWISGTNMIFKKRVLQQIGGFDPSLGMSGNKISYGEETNLVIKIRANRMQIFYCPSILVDHAILPVKLSLLWLLKSNYFNGKDGVRTFGFGGSLTQYLKVVIKGFLHAVKSFYFSDEVYIKTRIYRSLAPLCWNWGFFVKLIQSKIFK